MLCSREKVKFWTINWMKIMTALILYISMFLVLAGTYTLISVFGDDDNGGDGEVFSFDFDYLKAWY